MDIYYSTHDLGIITHSGFIDFASVAWVVIFAFFSLWQYAGLVLTLGIYFILYITSVLFIYVCILLFY